MLLRPSAAGCPSRDASRTGTNSTRACVDLWKLYDGIAKEKKPDNLYFANLGGGIRSTANLKQLGEVCDWFNCDNQGRGGEETPIWGCALQGRVCSAVHKRQDRTNVTAGLVHRAPRWRNVSKSPKKRRCG